MGDHETIRMMRDLETYVSKGVLALKVHWLLHPNQMRQITSGFSGFSEFSGFSLRNATAGSVLSSSEDVIFVDFDGVLREATRGDTPLVSLASFPLTHWQCFQVASV